MPLEQILLLASLGITLVLALLVFLLWRKLSQLEQVKPEDAVRKELEQQLFALKQDLGLTIQGLGNNNMQSITQLSQLLQDNQKIAIDAQRQQLEQMEKSMRTKQENMLFICRRENLSYDAGKDEYRFFRISEKRSAASCDFCKSF